MKTGVKIQWPLLLVFLVAAGCGDATATGGSGGSGGSSEPSGGGGAGAGGGGPQCSVATDCPGTSTECLEIACEDGACASHATAAGTALSAQVTGDCKVTVCDGAGSSEDVTDDRDVEDDGDACTADSCESGAAVHDPEQVGTPCDASRGVCDASGACVACLGPSDCGEPTECSSPTCDGGTCGVDDADPGTEVALQTQGDCKLRVCDGAGNVVAQNDDDPLDDQNPCTLDGCDAGSPTHVAEPGGPCGTNGTCDDQGQCAGCQVKEDCPGSDGFCKTRTCMNNVCGFQNLNEGQPLPTQTDGDCVTQVCQQGTAQPVVSPTDVFDDGNECTADTCIGAQPDNSPTNPGTPCGGGANLCDGNGSCVECLNASDCGDPPGYPCVVATCSPSGQCGTGNAPATTVCGPASCSSGVAEAADMCNGSGSCITGASMQCAPYVCGATSCTSSCTDDNGCASGNTCDTGLGVCTNGPTCTAYCNTIATACTTTPPPSHAQYIGQPSCLASCASFPRGSAADMSGNTVGCRSYHAQAALSDPATHCNHAGPGGAGVCGDDCTGFCTIAMAVCTGPNQQFLSMNACLGECQGYPTSPPYNTSVTSGDSFACRMYHLMAATGNPVLHCPHIKEMSATCQ